MKNIETPRGIVLRGSTRLMASSNVDIQGLLNTRIFVDEYGRPHNSALVIVDEASSKP